LNCIFEVPLGWGNDDSFNELLAVVHNDLALNALMGVVFGDEAKGIDLDQPTYT